MEAAFELITQPEVVYKPTDWQLEDFEQWDGLPYSADWSEMGCLKTTSTVWFGEQKLKLKNALIITSKNGKGAYFDSLPLAVKGWKIYNMTLQGMEEYINSELQVPVDADEILQTIKIGYHNEPWIVLIHYDCFSPRHSKKYDIVKRLSKIKWDLLVCDEAHKMKNRKTGWVTEIKKLRAYHRRVMTGTGFVNNPAEMWSLLNFLDRAKWSAYWEFRIRYCEEYVDARGFRVITGLRKSRIGEFRKMRKQLGPRHMMDEVHKDVSQPIFSTREVDLNATQRRMYNEIKAVLSTLDQQGELLSSPNVLSQLNRLRQICVATPSVISRQFSQTANRQVTEIDLIEPSSKLDEVMDILSEISWDDEARRQVVIFSNFKDPLKLLETRFEKADIPYLHLKVQMNEADRYRMWHDTFPKGEHRVLMSTLALGGESINLTSAQYLIFLDKSWSPKDMMQGIGRVYRPGQKHVPEVIYINARKTVDQYVQSKLDRKQGWFNEIFGK